MQCHRLRNVWSKFEKLSVSRMSPAWQVHRTNGDCVNELWDDHCDVTWDSNWVFSEEQNACICICSSFHHPLRFACEHRRRSLTKCQSQLKQRLSFAQITENHPTCGSTQWESDFIIISKINNFINIMKTTSSYLGRLSRGGTEIRERGGWEESARCCKYLSSFISSVRSSSVDHELNLNIHWLKQPPLWLPNQSRLSTTITLLHHIKSSAGSRRWQAGSSTTETTSKQPGSSLRVSMVRCIGSGVDEQVRRPRGDCGWEGSGRSRAQWRWRQSGAVQVEEGVGWNLPSSNRNDLTFARVRVWWGMNVKWMLWQKSDTQWSTGGISCCRRCC